jgi:hypothetical protein
MASVEKNFDWRIAYALFCLIYAGCLLYLGLGNINKVYGEYRQAVYRLQPEQIKRITFEELAQDCRAKLKRRSSRTKANTLNNDRENCQTFPQTVLKEYQKTVAKRLQIEKKRYQRKLVVFYLSFGLFFVALPLFLLYLFLKFLIWLFKDLKISK